MDLSSLSKVLDKLVTTLGPTLAVLLIVAALAAALGFSYMTLFWGHETVKLFIPLCRDVLKVLRAEAHSPHLPLQVESVMHVFLFLGFVLPTLALIAHAVLPWETRLDLPLFKSIMVGSIVLFAILTGISYKFALRFK